MFSSFLAESHEDTASGTSHFHKQQYTSSMLPFNIWFIHKNNGHNFIVQMSSEMG